MMKRTFLKTSQLIALSIFPFMGLFAQEEMRINDEGSTSFNSLQELHLPYETNEHNSDGDEYIRDVKCECEEWDKEDSIKIANLLGPGRKDLFKKGEEWVKKETAKYDKNPPPRDQVAGVSWNKSFKIKLDKVNFKLVTCYGDSIFTLNQDGSKVLDPAKDLIPNPSVFPNPIQADTCVEEKCQMVVYFKAYVSDRKTGITRFGGLKLVYLLQNAFADCKEVPSKKRSSFSKLLAGLSISNPYPNPVKDNNINFDMDLIYTQRVTVNIANLLGQTVSQTSNSYGIGKSTITIPTHSLPSGMYTYQVLVDGQTRKAGKFSKN